MLDVREVLEKLEGANLIKLGRPSGDWYMCHCPFHKDGQERKPSCGVSLRGAYKNLKFYPSGTFHCFTCGEVKTIQETLEFLFSKYNVSAEIANSIKSLVEDIDYTYETAFNSSDLDDIASIVRPKRSSYSPYPAITEDELASYRYTVPYMYKRKLTDDVIAKFDVGFDPNWKPYGWKTPIPCITFPVRDRNGKVLFIVRRSIEGKFFFLPENIKKPVYGLDTVPDDCKFLCICESIINALTCIVYGVPAVALIGTGDDYQYSQLSSLGVMNFILALDPDEAGQKGTRRLIKRFKGSRILWKMNLPADKDVNDLTAEEFQWHMQNLEFI